MDNYFHFSTTLHNYLFGGVDVLSLPSFIGLCVAVGLVCMGNEGVRVARSHLVRHIPLPPPSGAVRRQQRQPTNDSRETHSSRPSDLEENGDDEARGRTNNETPTQGSYNEEQDMMTATSVQDLLFEAQEGAKRIYDTRPLHLTFQSLVHVFYITISYLLMLTVMTFNSYIFISILIGIGLGYFLFGTFDMMLTSNKSPYLYNHVVGGLPRVVRVGNTNSCVPKDRCRGSVCSNNTHGPGNEHHQHCGDGTAGSSDGAGPSSSVIAVNSGAACSGSLSDGSDGTPDRDRALLLVNSGEITTSGGGGSQHPEHRTSDIVGLLCEEVTVDVHA